MYDNPELGDYVSFKVTNDLEGKGKIIGKASNGIMPSCNMWIVSIELCETDYMIGLVEHNWEALVVQQTFLDKTEKTW